MSRFRRSLAWHVARRPGGLIALAIQYGHMRTVLDARTSSGYGSRSGAGMHSVLDVETALAAADTAAEAPRPHRSRGEGLWPGRPPSSHAAATNPRFEGRTSPDVREEGRRFLARDGVVLYDNPDAFLICAFKHDNALCEPEPDATAPRQYDCQSGCGNTVRTDTHARLLRERADEIDQFAAARPGRSPDGSGRMPTGSGRQLTPTTRPPRPARPSHDLQPQTETNAPASARPWTGS